MSRGCVEVLSELYMRVEIDSIRFLLHPKTKAVNPVLGLKDDETARSLGHVLDVRQQ
jgi:hypothetical protein